MGVGPVSHWIIRIPFFPISSNNNRRSFILDFNKDSITISTRISTANLLNHLVPPLRPFGSDLTGEGCFRCFPFCGTPLRHWYWIRPQLASLPLLHSRVTALQFHPQQLFLALGFYMLKVWIDYSSIFVYSLLALLIYTGTPIFSVHIISNHMTL